MKRSLFLFASTVGLLCLAGTQARAGIIPAPNAQWTYNFTPSTPFVAANAPGTGSVTFTNEQQPLNPLQGQSDVVATDLRTSTLASSSNPDSITHGAYTISMKLTDIASGASATVSFSGFLHGTFSTQNANVQNTWTSPTTTTVSLGAFNYIVSATSYSPPGPPSQHNAGSITVHVEPSALQGADSAPEPSSMVLSCLGLAFVGVASWRKRRRTLASLLA